jgi:hypothetical protein
MPWHIRAIGRYGNAALLAIFALFVLAFLSKGQAGMALAALAVCALAGFNLYLVAKTARLLGEEAWLESELRKAELRRRLAEEYRVDLGPRPVAAVDATPARPMLPVRNDGDGDRDPV